jgi:hypothetical protein
VLSVGGVLTNIKYVSGVFPTVFKEFLKQYQMTHCTVFLGICCMSSKK